MYLSLQRLNIFAISVGRTPPLNIVLTFSTSIEGLLPLYTPLAFALAMPSSWRSLRRLVSNSAKTHSISRNAKRNSASRERGDCPRIAERHSQGGTWSMIASGVVVYVSCQPVDFRKGAASLMALARDGGLDPFSGALHLFSPRGPIGLGLSGGMVAACASIRKFSRKMASAGRPRQWRGSGSTMPN